MFGCGSIRLEHAGRMRPGILEIVEDFGLPIGDIATSIKFSNYSCIIVRRFSQEHKEGKGR
jgi:hypothetical protein